MQRTLAAVLAEEVRPQDAPGLLHDVAERGGASLDAAWAFLRTCARRPPLNSIVNAFPTKLCEAGIRACRLGFQAECNDVLTNAASPSRRGVWEMPVPKRVP